MAWNRWAYHTIMPPIPGLGVGLIPVLQMVVLPLSLPPVSRDGGSSGPARPLAKDEVPAGNDRFRGYLSLELSATGGDFNALYAPKPRSTLGSFAWFDLLIPGGVCQ